MTNRDANGSLYSSNHRVRYACIIELDNPGLNAVIRSLIMPYPKGTLNKLH